MTDNPQAQASTTVHLPDSNTHTLTLDPTRTYYFILGEVGTNGKERPSGAYVTSKPSINGQYRENIVINPLINTNVDQSKQAAGTNTPGIPGLNAYLNLTGGSYLNVRFNDGDDSSIGGPMEELGFYVNYYSIHVAEPSGGHFVRSPWFAKLLGETGGHPEVKSVTDTSGNTFWNWAYRYWDIGSPIAGRWDYDDDRYRNNHANGDFKISLLYHAPSEPYFSFWGTPYFIYRVSVCGAVAAEGRIPLKAGGEYITPAVKVTAPAQCPGTNSILATPASATIYIHPKLPASGSQQYTAKDGNGTVVTNSVSWQSDKPTIAMINAAGLAAPPQPLSTAKPGSAAITAMLNNVTSNKAELCVDCWEVTHIRQNKHVPNDKWPNWVPEPYGMDWHVPIRARYKWGYYVLVYGDVPRTNSGPIDYTGLHVHSIGRVGCHMVSAAMILTATTGEFVNPWKLNQYLTQNDGQGYMKDNGPRWNVIQSWTNSKILKYTIYNGMEEINPKTKAVIRTREQSYALIDQSLDNCNMVVLHVTGRLPSHYVLAVKGKDGDYYIYDPWYYGGDKDQHLDRLLDRYSILDFNIITIQQ